MRYILAAVSLVISLVLLGLGIGQRTIWAPPDSIVAQLEQPTDAQIIVISGDTLNQHDGRQTLTISGDGQVTAVVGRDHDVLGWVGETSYAAAQLDERDAIVLDEHGGNDEPVPSMAGSDMWIEEHAGARNLQFDIDVPVGFSIAITGEPGSAAPAEVQMEWPFDAKTPLFGPLMTAGLIFLALALLFFLLALRRHRRRRGPQRRSHRDLSRAERRALQRDARAGLPRPERTIAPADDARGQQGEIESADETPGDSASEQDVPEQEKPESGRSERRAVSPARRRLGLIAFPMLAAITLTGCGPQYWPSPEASETEAVPTPTTLEDTLPPVALTENQFDRVLEASRSIVRVADEDLNRAHAALRLGGPVLEARATNYEILGQSDEIEALPGIPDGGVQLLLPQQTEIWPRTVMAVVAWQDAERAQSMLVFEQSEARENYRVVYQTTLASGVQVPAVASPSIGAASLPDNTPLLQREPAAITTAYADVLMNGDDSEFASWFQEDGDALREHFGKAWKDEQRANPDLELISLAWSNGEDDQAPLMLVTNDGGALLATSFTETQRATPDEEGVEVSASAGAAILTGVEESTTGIEQTYQMQVLFAVPPADAPEGTQIRVIGYSQSLIDAREVQE